VTTVDSNTQFYAAMAAMLLVAVWRDLRWHRIDNGLVLGGIVAAIALNAVLGGVAGVGSALGGLIVGLLLLLPFYARGGMAAGDVKLMAAAGAFLGPVDAAWAAGGSLIAGGLIAFAILLRGDGLHRGVVSTGRQFFDYAMARVWVPAAPGSAAARRFPYASAIAIGCMTVALWRVTHASPVPA
jgi:prepilin peptidase CpaA